MIIKYKGYTLKPGQYAKDRFDLLKTENVTMKEMSTMRKKYGDVPIGTIVGEKEEEIAYDLTLDSAIQKLVLYSLSEKEDTTDLRSWLFAYKKEMEDIKNLFKI